MQAALISGALFKEPQIKTSAKGRQFVTASMKAKEGDNFVFWRVTGFSQHVIDELTPLKDGDRLAVQGQLQIELYDAKDGSKAISRCVIADNVLPLRGKPKERSKSDAEPIKRSQDASGSSDYSKMRNYGGSSYDDELNDAPF